MSERVLATRRIYSLHELLVMAALAALGGGFGSVLSRLGEPLRATLGPGGMQFLAGAHVLWLILAVGLVRRRGAATLTSLLKGAVELFSGSPHGLLAVLYCGLAGAAVDAVWLLLGRRDHPLTYVLAGGLGSATNVLVFKLAISLPAGRAATVGLGLLAGVAFLSGTLLGGCLGWTLLRTLRRAGVAGTQAPA